MHKPAPAVYREFRQRFRLLTHELHRPLQLIEYFISGHPGCTLDDMIELALELRQQGIKPEQVQEFYPVPLTLAGAMYYTGLDPLSGKAVYVARSDRDKSLQRALLLCHLPEFQRKAREVLREAGRANLIGRGPGCLVPPGP
jgi:radical SAM superfamily enzyme YgiQ (UPF0313 family)